MDWKTESGRSNNKVFDKKPAMDFKAARRTFHNE
jgi:hypothetical protein